MTSAANTIPRNWRNWILYGFVAGLLLLLHFYYPPQRGLWARVFFDSLHVPVFGLISVTLFAAFTRLPIASRVLLAFAVAAVLSVLSEAAQLFTARDASLKDLVADLLGAAGFLATAVAVASGGGVSTVRRILAAIVALLALSWPLLPLAKVSSAYIERNAQVPVLVSFESRLGGMFIRRQYVDLDTIENPGGQLYARVSLLPGAWPGVTFHDLWPDWRDYSTLVLDLSSDSADPVTLNLRVHDREHIRRGNAYTDRYTTTLTISPGRQEIAIPLTDVRAAPRDREMDLSNIEGIIIFGRKEDAGISFNIHQVRLR